VSSPLSAFFHLRNLLRPSSFDFFGIPASPSFPSESQIHLQSPIRCEPSEASHYIVSFFTCHYIVSFFTFDVLIAMLSFLCYSIQIVIFSKEQCYSTLSTQDGIFKGTHAIQPCQRYSTRIRTFLQSGVAWVWAAFGSSTGRWLNSLPTRTIGKRTMEPILSLTTLPPMVIASFQLSPSPENTQTGAHHSMATHSINLQTPCVSLQLGICATMVHPLPPPLFHVGRTS
jgi:hypothetical protein